MDIMLPNYIDEVLRALATHGHEAFCVGGCVRDSLLGIPPNDWDVCTNATPGEIEACFSGCKLALSGIKHGTVGVVTSGGLVEITTYRADGAYTDHRRPDCVRYSDSLAEDLSRRDFTINAMAYAPGRGLVDPHGGQSDLASGLIRCVGNPGARFAEDALRILRALRFASRLGFSIDEETARALLAHRDALRFIAPERVLAELSGMVFSSVDPRFLPVLQSVLPELVSIDVPAGLPKDPAVQFAALLRGLAPAPILSRLRASNALRDRATLLVSLAGEPVASDEVGVRRLLRRVGPNAAAQLYALTCNRAAQKTLAAVLQRGDCYTLAALNIDGAALLALGLKGKAVGGALNALLDQVIDGALPNDPPALLHAAAKL